MPPRDSPRANHQAPTAATRPASGAAITASKTPSRISESNANDESPEWIPGRPWVAWSVFDPVNGVDVQVVDVGTGDIVDAVGNPSPTVTLTGGGRAYVFRDGRMIVGRWQRDTLDDVTRFLTRSGEEITLAPGTTWVELFPSALSVEAG